MPTNEDQKATVAILEKQLDQHMKEFNEMRTAVALSTASIAALVKSIELLVTRFEFTPVKLLVYGMACTIFTSVLAAILSKVILK